MQRQIFINVRPRVRTSSTVSSLAKPSSSGVGACTATSAVAPVARQKRRRSNFDGILLAAVTNVVKHTCVDGQQQGCLAHSCCTHRQQSGQALRQSDRSCRAEAQLS